MKILYLDCSMGAAGDMLAGALLELLEDKEEVIRQLNQLGLPEVRIEWEESLKCGITGSRFKVLVKGREEESLDEMEPHAGGHQHGYGHTHMGDHQHEHHHSHSTLHRIRHLVKEHLAVSDKVKEDILAVYTLIAEAESRVHHVPVEEIHFHEVGTMDALADITAVCLLMDRLAPDQVVVSPIHVGSGQVRCSHGILPVPAPATAYILQGIPIYGGRIKAELCTPTGAALLKYFAASFAEMPPMRIKALGYGMGKKDFEAANCVRAMWGESFSLKDGGQRPDQNEKAGARDAVWELSCNLDDMTAEEIGFALEMLLEAGAVEVYTTPIGMKKSRPGTKISVLCKEEKKAELVQTIFKYTTTLGIREKELHRYILERSLEQEDTPLGRLHYKKAEGYGISRRKYEYEELAALARKHELSLEQVRQSLKEQRKE